MAREFFSEIEPSDGKIVGTEEGQLYYEEYGQGHVLVLLHGFGGSGKNWYPFLRELVSRTIQVV